MSEKLVTVKFVVEAKSNFDAYMIVSRIFASLSLPDAIKNMKIESEKEV